MLRREKQPWRVALLQTTRNIMAVTSACSSCRMLVTRFEKCVVKRIRRTRCSREVHFTWGSQHSLPNDANKAAENDKCDCTSGCMIDWWLASFNKKFVANNVFFVTGKWAKVQPSWEESTQTSWRNIDCAICDVCDFKATITLSVLKTDTCSC